MYAWYQEQYVGAAHGLAGIYYYLMQVSPTTHQLSGESKAVFETAYKRTAYYILNEFRNYILNEYVLPTKAQSHFSFLPLPLPLTTTPLFRAPLGTE